MPSQIDPTHFADGQPVSKADLRAALASAKAELEHGGFVKIQATGSVERQVSRKVGEILSLGDFGAKLDGSTDDTSALQKAVDYAELSYMGRGRSVIEIKGETVLDYAALSPPTVPITLRVDGRLLVKSTLVVNAALNIIGVGGFNNQTQFHVGPSCIINPTGALSGPCVQMLDNGYMEGVAVWGAGGANPCVLIGRRATDPLVSGGRQTALVKMIRCAVLGLNGPTAAIKVENTFWLWILEFMAGCNTGPSIWLADSYAPGWANNPCGLIDIKDGVISDGGIEFGTAGAPAAGGIHFWFDDIHYENVHAPFIKMNSAANWVSDVRLSRIGFADPIDGLEHALVDNTVGADIRDIVVQDINAMYVNSPPFVGTPPRRMRTSLFNTLTYNSTYNILAGQPVKGFYDLENEVEFCDAFGAAGMAPQMVPADAVHLATNQNMDGMSVPGGVIRTTAQKAPDGSLTATRLANSGGQTGLATTYGVSGLTDHWIYAGIWIKSVDQTKSPTIGGFSTAFAVVFTGGTTMTIDGAAYTGSPLRIENARSLSKQAGWVFVSYGFRLQAAVSPTDMQYHILIGANRDNYYWRPFSFALPAANWSRRDFSRLVSKLQVVDTSVKPGVLGQVNHQTFRTGAGVTGSRPVAAAVGAGAQWFDTTLGKPIWSDGTRWKDAVGNAI